MSRYSPARREMRVGRPAASASERGHGPERARRSRALTFKSQNQQCGGTLRRSVTCRVCLGRHTAIRDAVRSSFSPLGSDQASSAPTGLPREQPRLAQSKAESTMWLEPTERVTAPPLASPPLPGQRDVGVSAHPKRTTRLRTGSWARLG